MVSKKEQSIKLLLVIVNQKRLYFAHPQHYFSTWFCVILYAYLSKKYAYKNEKGCTLFW